MRKTFLILTIFITLNSYSQVHTLKESIFFGLGKTNLTQAHKLKLDSVILLLKASKKYTGEIKGYTCNIGSSSLNKLVSNLRALNVYNYLVDKGADRNNFKYAGYSFNNPLGDNHTASGRAMNRRTDIEVLLSLFDENASTGSESTTNTSTGTANSNATKETITPTVEIGPEFTSGKIPILGNKKITSSNGISINIDKNSLISSSKEPVDVDIKDYTQNYDIIKKGMMTTGSCTNLKLLGAFSTNFTQEYQELSINPTKPVIVSIPSEYFPNMKLYSNPRNWKLDSLNKMTYNHTTKTYDVAVIDNSQVIGILEPNPDTIYFLKVKIKGLSPELIKPYVVYDNCLISMCCRQEGKWFLIPITQKSSSYNVRSMYTDYSSKNADVYSVNYDIKNVDLSQLKKIKDGNIIIYKYPEKIKVMKEKLPKSSLCEIPRESN